MGTGIPRDRLVGTTGKCRPADAGVVSCFTALSSGSLAASRPCCLSLVQLGPSSPENAEATDLHQPNPCSLAMVAASKFNTPALDAAPCVPVNHSTPKTHNEIPGPSLQNQYRFHSCKVLQPWAEDDESPSSRHRAPLVCHSCHRGRGFDLCSSLFAFARLLRRRWLYRI